jgi:3',5'-nucleoside bisphosphate phosphatase
MARALGLRAIAITDHETTQGVEPAQRAALGTELVVVPGVEISTESSLGEVHILGYWIDPAGGGLEQRLRRLREGRLERAQKMVQKLANLGIPLSWERVRELAAGESVGRPHIARAMVEKGYVESIDQAFVLYIGHDGPAYVPRLRVTPAEAIAMVHRAHGVAVLAHPLQVAALVPSLVPAGLQGLEASYSGYSADEVQYLADIAKQHGLLQTGGSDFHGPGVCGDLGGATASCEVVDEMKAIREG